MSLVMIVAGLILLLAGSGWFAGAATVGTILLIVGAIVLCVQLGMWAFAASQVRRF